MFTSSIFTGLGFGAAVFLVPETLPSVASHNEHEERQPLLAAEGPDGSSKRGTRSYMQAQITRAANLGRWVMDHVGVVPIVICFFFFYLGEQRGNSLLLQYASKRLDWPLSKVRRPRQKLTAHDPRYEC